MIENNRVYAKIIPMGIEEKVKNNIIKDKLFRKGERILVGVSGGADSVCLIHILNRLKDELKIKLYIAHLDHGLRNDSRKDAEFVKDLAKNLNIPVAIKRVQIKRIRGNLSIEEAARNTRLDFLLKEAVKAGAKKVALAHNFDDQAETVLMRILRGTGLYGLSAMASKRKANNLFLIRPLLNIKRGEIEAFLKKNNIAFRTDKSNTQEIYLRNRIRLELLPCLEKKYNKNIKEALFSL
ncbi:MAG: tRNA lysidine(34) synthetase TilS, partial [Candidatus Omnitrophica bacterium]|nr:tRNA lysidine(34) synthetase TilS [Candidatus Omnitrophota bacterium]